ncbi:MAG TPA: hypothetical protein VLB29_13585 [Nocardioidaceae bacterium]|nr:hypothetical protein [Nocardioidaceae bacterium]
MYLLDPTTAIDLARYRVEQDLRRAEAHRLAKEARAAGRSERSTRGRRGRRRRFVPVRITQPRFGH